MACNLPARFSVSCGCRSLRAPQPARARPRASRRARVSALQTTERRGDAPGGPAAPLASTDAPDSIFLEEELVGAYSFTEAHIKRFSALHATMQQCGWSFIVVAGATVLGVVAKVRPPHWCRFQAGILALVYKMGHRPGHFINATWQVVQSFEHSSHAAPGGRRVRRCAANAVCKEMLRASVAQKL
jgi:hypothetical protein